eukprot:756605-Hanusia_phi.AAC.1
MRVVSDQRQHACLSFLLFLIASASGVYVGPAIKPQSQNPYRGRDSVFHMQLDISGSQLDHLILSSNHTLTDLYVLFYVPTHPLAQVGRLHCSLPKAHKISCRVSFPSGSKSGSASLPSPASTCSAAVLFRRSDRSRRSSKLTAAELAGSLAGIAMWLTSRRSRGFPQGSRTGFCIEEGSGRLPPPDHELITRQSRPAGARGLDHGCLQPQSSDYLLPADLFSQSPSSLPP